MLGTIHKAIDRVRGGMRPRPSRWAGLNVVELEERATPALAELVGTYPPESFLVAPIVPAAVAEPAPAAPAVLTEAAVRTDLFCAGDDTTADPAEFWDEWFAAEEEAAAPVETQKDAPPQDEIVAPPKVDANAAQSPVVFVAEGASEGGGD